MTNKQEMKNVVAFRATDSQKEMIAVASMDCGLNSAAFCRAAALSRVKELKKQSGALEE